MIYLRAKLGEVWVYLPSGHPSGPQMADPSNSPNGDVDANSPCGGEMVDSGHGHGDVDELPMGMV